MCEPSTVNARAAAWASVWVSAVLSAAFAVATGFGVWLALSREDTEVSESSLILSVARQLVRGPWGLYGPFGRENLQVLIHAPLYYRLAALLAWPLTSAGLDVVSAARLAGRSLSLLGLGVTAWSAYRIARLDGAPARAGWWAACLIASVPVVGNMPFTVRPDMLGVGLQTTGVMLVLTALLSERPSGRAIAGAFALFGLAVCVKQPFVGGPIVSTILLVWASRNRPVVRGRVKLGLLIALTVLAAVYLIEELASQGWMSRSAFMAAAGTARIHPVGWKITLIVLVAIIGRSSFLIGLMAAAAMGQLTVKRRGAGLVALTMIGTAAVGTVAILRIFRLSNYDVAISTAAVSVCLFLIIPICVFVERRTIFANRLDASLCLFAAAEAAIVVALCQASAGAWVNYGIQTIVFAAILTARSVARACEQPRVRRDLVLIALASLPVLAFVLQDSRASVVRLRDERRLVARVNQAINRPSSEIFFVGSPGRNRLYGNVDLVYDDWLYPVFESMRLAEPRSAWLERALTDGSIRVVVNNSDGSRIDGLRRSLPALGYMPRFEIDPLYTWERVSSPREQ